MRWLAVALLGMTAACTETDRETEIRAFVEAAVAAAENRETGHFRSIIAPSYADDRGGDRDRVIDTVRGFFLVNSQVEAAADILSVVWDGTASARLVLDIDVEGRGNRYSGTVEFELLRERDDWSVIGARWNAIDRHDSL
jgi:hypothetical protein